MGIKIIPLIVSTEEALNICLSGSWSVIYIENALYSQNRERIGGIMRCRGYSLAGETARHGAFYLNTKERNAFDPDLHEIADPLGIL